jgi:hypothetical protein
MALLESIMTPAPGVCGRCGGAATFYPTVVSREPRRIEALLICQCCSFSSCQHRCPFVDADGVQCRARYGHATLRSLPDGWLHDCRRDDNVRVAQYGGRFTPKRHRVGEIPEAWIVGFLMGHAGSTREDAAAAWAEQTQMAAEYRRQNRPRRR